MPQNPAPVDDYVSVIFDHTSNQSTNHRHHHAHHHSILLQAQSTSSQDTQTLFLVPSASLNQQLTHQAPSRSQSMPEQQQVTATLHLQSPTLEARQGLEEALTGATEHSHRLHSQSIVSIATSNLPDPRHPGAAVAVAAPDTSVVGPELKNRLLLLTDLPGTSTILQVPSVGSTCAAVIQVQPALQVPQQMSLIEVPPPTLNLVQFSSSLAAPSVFNDASTEASTAASSVELVPTTVYIANSDQQLILCLPPDMTLQASSNFIVEQDSLLSVDSPVPHSLTENVSLAKNSNSLHPISSSDFNQVAMAKLWHSDSDLVNRALTALGRHNSSNDSSTVLPLQHLHLNCTSSASN